jgi:hypothetical protein
MIYVHFPAMLDSDFYEMVHNTIGISIFTRGYLGLLSDIWNFFVAVSKLQIPE